MKYDYWTKTQELVPSLGTNKYFAIAEIYEIGKGKIKHSLGEMYGKTEAEAKQKMDNKIKSWLKKNNKNKDFYTAEDLAKKLDVNIMTIYRYIKAGKLEAYKLGKEFRIDKEKFESFLQANKIN